MNPKSPKIEKDATFKVAGIGELLWDVFPNRKRLGGAPANFTYHAHQLGMHACLVSCIGKDAHGKEIRRKLEELGLDSSYVSETGRYPTGIVDVVVKAGKPTYEIHENVAWDQLPLSEELLNLAPQLDAVCFGSLAQRATGSRNTIHAFLRQMRERALKIFDVNLRQAFFSKDLVTSSLELANLLKLSDEELPVLAKFFDLKGEVEEQLRQLAETFSLKTVAYTRGPRGSLLIDGESAHDFPGCEGLAIDSVGAGDAYTASLCTGLLKGWPIMEANEFANRVATFVCSQRGATPVLPQDLINDYADMKCEETI